VHDLFRARFGRAPDVVASAPGRVNLIGEHVDYNGGDVLPTVLPQRTTVALARRPDATARVHTTLGDRAAEFRIGEERATGGWTDYVQATTWGLARAGHPIGGFDATIDSTLPPGSGLSSSAALMVAFLRALRDAHGCALDDGALARLAHSAEADFVGAPVGPMDQMVVALGLPGTALFLHTRTLAWERVPLPPSADLVVLDSGVRHALAAGGGYAERRAECARAAKLLGTPDLCALGPADLRRIVTLPRPLDRRARHVVTEHARVARAVAAMRADHVDTLGRLFFESHVSQRDDYEVSVPEVDRLVEIARRDADVLGARLTGGGFGGAVVILAAHGRGSGVAARVATAYARATGGAASIVLPLTT
jgi:galactokinase